MTPPTTPLALADRYSVMHPEPADNLGLVYALNFRNAIVGLAHDDGRALLYIARENPTAMGHDWPETVDIIGAGHQGLRTLRTLLRARLAMTPRLANVVAFLFRPYILCLAPPRRDLASLLAHDDAHVRHTTQLNLNPEGT